MDPPPPPASTDATGVQHIRLACQACQRKKIKCDRTFPCGQCQRSNLQCAQSTRKPRVKRVGKRAVDSELRSRITKLESLVESLSGEVGLQEEEDVPQAVSPDKPETPREQHDTPSPSVGKYMGSPFWATLVNEVQALRDALEEDPSDAEPAIVHPVPASTSTHEGSIEHDLLICPPASISVMPGALLDPPPAVLKQLDEIFLKNVDPVFKVLHRPTVERLLQGDSYFGQAPDAPPNRALRATMWFAAVTTISDAECFARFRQSRNELLHLYRRHVDVAMAQADLINTSDLATLQAFVLYTASARITDRSRRAWTMTGLVVRIAHGMGLHREIGTDSPYMKEIKRRLWHQIRVLDAFSAVDRGTELLVQMSTSDTPLPSNVNDSEFNESTEIITNREEGLSDMTFNLMAHWATTLTMKLLTPEESGSKGQTWQQRLDSSLSLGKQLREKYLQYCDLSIPFHRFLYTVGNSMAASSVLRAVRPMQKHVSSVPPRVDSPFVLQLAVNSLKESESTHVDPETEGWRWIFWVQWHALAVALAGLCSIRDNELASTAWQYVDKAYERHARHVADSRSGMLWKPIEKLYKKASAFRDGATATTATTTTTTSPRHSMSISALTIPQENMENLSINMPSSTSTAPTYPVSSTQAQLPVGAMPLSGVLNASMDFPWSEGYTGTSPLQMGDMSWMDWERIMEDISGLQNSDSAFSGPNVTMGDVQAMNMGGEWPYSMQGSRF
ncbi:hypothetical protein M409DRAFT_27806 [Zasmidium cellare ATCC 36951]|uniref:Zn(2)-C6 fungal-type domain-containing protein n=1 Tax=Zasmidium cellare ATCC 36951 TaxID=1080233 RepID=A0A6A6C7N4_ZASCE|nr:uncharacterized protein M409DRAFT_27806 [Zasmidium cellare ATCC 36951]KAF2161749.1 hypothetical protein M409DRAFT_27806 [Zasmidium cellare ATCC 36951]